MLETMLLPLLVRCLSSSVPGLRHPDLNSKLKWSSTGSTTCPFHMMWKRHRSSICMCQNFWLLLPIIFWTVETLPLFVIVLHVSLVKRSRRSTLPMITRLLCLRQSKCLSIRLLKTLRPLSPKCVRMCSLKPTEAILSQLTNSSEFPRAELWVCWGANNISFIWSKMSNKRQQIEDVKMGCVKKRVLLFLSRKRETTHKSDRFKELLEHIKWRNKIECHDDGYETATEKPKKMKYEKK